MFWEENYADCGKINKKDKERLPIDVCLYSIIIIFSFCLDWDWLSADLCQFCS